MERSEQESTEDKERSEESKEPKHRVRAESVLRGKGAVGELVHGQEALFS